MSGAVIKSAIGVALVAMAAGSYLSSATEKGGGPGMSLGWFSTSPATRPPVTQARQQPAAPVQRVGYGREELTADAAGQYRVSVEIEGNRLAMLVDTGATLVSLTYEDATRLGYAPAPADYTVPIQTANGLAKAASLTIRELRLGTLMVSNVPAVILPRDIKGVSLLGMSFLKKLGGFEIASNKLLLRQ